MVAEEYLEELIDRSLILVCRRLANGRMKTCKIHDLLRQLCIREAQMENFVHVLSDSDHISSESLKYQRRAMLSLGNHRNHFYVPRHWKGITSTTSSLVLLGYSSKLFQMPEFVSRFKLLKVLEVSSVQYNFSWVIAELVHLRYVAANIKVAPSLDKLWNLQTIILCNISNEDFHLPLEIWTMSEIRHLSIRWSIHMPNPLEAESLCIVEQEQPLLLNNLQKLVLPSSPFLAEILRRTPNLKKITIIYMKSADWPAILDSLVLLVQELETLAIIAERDNYPFILPRDIFLPNLKHLRLTGTCFPWEDMVALANLPNLEKLKAYSAFEGTNWKLNEDAVFHKLKYLKIVNAINLERWEATSDNFPMLEQLLLSGLKKLEEIPQRIGEIMTLKFIEIEWCSSAADTSAMKIQEEQTNCGNDSLEVQIKPAIIGIKY
uniref:Late blight resistance protein homolog R1B-11 n=1 Tax=Nicotiana tabacum TaxID=4097 RepID=A0A1S3Y6Y7_TOBAC|nr:PREDICTED: putative late blight resistance protein homolog R1B-11 [Nicotiana tabacum]